MAISVPLIIANLELAGTAIAAWSARVPLITANVRLGATTIAAWSAVRPPIATAIIGLYPKGSWRQRYGSETVLGIVRGGKAKDTVEAKPRIVEVVADERCRLVMGVSNV